VKTLYNKKGQRRGEGERHPFAFFAIGAIVVLAAVFVIGLQVGRVIEKSSSAPDAHGGKNAPSPGSQAAPPVVTSDIRKDLGAYSEEAVKVPIVPPPDAKSTVNEVEKKLTFRETLAKKEPTPVPLVRAAQKDNTVSSGGETARASGARKTVVQAGAFREKRTAESYRKRLDKAGYSVRVVQAARKNGEKYYRVLVGPFPDIEEARKAVRRLKDEMKIDAYMFQG
jgi:septal ring-binding cell division protein DamX